MKTMLCLWTATLLVGIAAAPFYGESIQTKVTPESIRQDWPQLREAAQSAEQTTRIFLQKLRACDPIRADIIALRLATVQQLLQYIDQQLKSPDTEAVHFARQGMFELKSLIAYQNEEIKRFEMMSKAPLELELSDFGAKGDGAADDAPAFARAIRRAAELQKQNPDRPVKINIAAGNYRLSGNRTPDRNFVCRDGLRPGMPDIRGGDPLWPTGHIVIANQNYLTLQGKGKVKLLPDDSTLTAVNIVGSQNIVLDGLEIEFPDLPFTQGEIIAADPENKSVIWQIDAGYPAPDLPRFLKAPQRLGSLHQKDGSFIWPASTIFFGEVKKLDGQQYQIQLLDQGESKAALRYLKPGLKLTVTARYDTAKAVNLQLSSFCDIANVRVTSSPGVVFGLWQCNAINFYNCRIAPPEGSDRLLTSGGDAFQSSQNLIGPAVINCEFTGMLDDGIMICTRQSKIIAAKDNNTKVLAPGLPGRPGTRCGVMDPQSGMLKSEAVCIGMTLDADWGDGKRGTEFEFDRPLVIDTTMESAPGKILSHSEMIPYYTGLKPFPKQPDALITLDYANSGTVISGNRLHNYRGGGVAIRGAANIGVWNNHIRNLSHQTFAVGALMSWGESFPSHNILFSGNQSLDSSAALLVHFNTFAGQAESRIIRAITLDGNRFADIRKTGIYLGSCQEIDVKQNTFSSATAQEAICLGNTDQVNFEDNTISFDKVPPDKIFSRADSSGNITVNGQKLSK